MDTNRLSAAPTHDAYLDNGTDIGLTVGILILAYAKTFVNILHNFSYREFKYTFQYSLLPEFLENLCILAS